MKEKTILDTLADAARARVEENKKKKPMEVLKKEAKSLAADTGFPFEKALAAPGISVICEVKKASQRTDCSRLSVSGNRAAV